MGAVALAALAGCSSPAPAEEGAAPAKPEATAASQAAALPVCGEVFVPDKPVNGFDEQTGCTGKDGTVQFIGAIECGDGTKLWPVDASTGAPTGYGREGQAYRVVKGEVQADNGYKQAYEDCMKEAPASAGPAPSAAAG
ncbi:hypothetical protein [Actinoplanes sp. CA-252034]|uniref:hypothetical protein n=1 Tax=Actinoplanes sp. CA-252034 TaxID=3239906 RepID=UPI003D9679BF